MSVLKSVKHEKFAIGIAKGLSPAQAYKGAGYKGGGHAASGSKLQNMPLVSQRIAEIREKISEKVITSTVEFEIGDRNHRVKALQDRVLAMRQIVSERSQDPEVQSIPGGRTGHVVLTWRNSKKVAEVDIALLRELRAHEEQAARELGQWVEKQAQTNAAGKDILLLSQLMTVDELIELERRQKAQLTTGTTAEVKA